MSQPGLPAATIPPPQTHHRSGGRLLLEVIDRSRHITSLLRPGPLSRVGAKPCPVALSCGASLPPCPLRLCLPCSSPAVSASSCSARAQTRYLQTSARSWPDPSQTAAEPTHSTEVSAHELPLPVPPQPCSFVTGAPPPYPSVRPFVPHYHLKINMRPAPRPSEHRDWLPQST